jgi:hypothetical protein
LTIQGQATCAHAGTSLPIEIGFLATQGVAPETLRQASHIAIATGVSADVAILKAGLIEEHAFYRALANEVGLPFLDGDFDLAATTQFPENITMGVAPLGPNDANARLALAPRGERLTSTARTAPSTSPSWSEPNSRISGESLGARGSSAVIRASRLRALRIHRRLAIPQRRARHSRSDAKSAWTQPGVLL